jgi:hypothetical protein
MGDVQKWQYSAKDTVWSDIPGTTSTTYTATNLTVKTWFRAVVAGKHRRVCGQTRRCPKDPTVSEKPARVQTFFHQPHLFICIFIVPN